MRELIELFSDPKIRSTASFRCCTDGPTEFDILFESIVDEQYGYDPNSEYKRSSDVFIASDLFQQFPVNGQPPRKAEEVSLWVRLAM
jgi:hypothetical protein